MKNEYLKIIIKTTEQMIFNGILIRQENEIEFSEAELASTYFR